MRQALDKRETGWQDTRAESGSSRRRFLLKTLSWGALAVGGRTCLLAAEAGGGSFEPDKSLIPAPSDPAQWPAFRKELEQWRARQREQLAYDDSWYRHPDFEWVSTCFACCFLMMNDETFYEAKTGRYLVEGFLDHGVKEFGGYDAVVLWHAYPRIGVDDRNQFDFYRDMPGGLAGLRELTHRFHRRNVRVFIDYNPWDTGTRREGKPDLDAVVEMVGAIQADGIFLDTMDRGAEEFRAKLDAVRRGVVLEGEGALPLENVRNHHMSWAQWFADSAVPGVLRNKWFERRHLQHQIRRWDRDHSGELHTAWMNGSGMMVWENVFGQWIGWNPRDRSLYRLMLPVQRRFAGLFSAGEWTPLVPTEQKTVFATLWQGKGLRLWTLVNRSASPVEGPLFQLGGSGAVPVYDLIRGRRVRVEPGQKGAVIAGSFAGRGVGAYVQGTPSALGRDFTWFLESQSRLFARANFETTFPARRTELRSLPRSQALSALPADMVEVAGATVTLQLEFRVREVGFYDSTQDTALTVPGLHQPISFQRTVTLPRYGVDLTPVTNRQFAEFLRATSYRPASRENFLRHWTDGQPPGGKEDHPVTYVSLDDARAFARWAGKRLPTEEEWQYAAQGPQGLKYPWGDQMEANRCNAGETGATTEVRAFPKGRSPFGCYDLCGNVWEWTESERSDGRSRFCIVKGGCYYTARGSDWYFDGGPRPNQFAAKFPLMWPGLDRCATVGFRCACDLG